MFETTGTIIMKVTRDCNLRCEYCYVRNKEKYSGEKIEFDLFKKIIDRVIHDKQLVTSDRKHIQFVFHGGEPTIIGVEYLSKLLKYAYDKFLDSDIPFDFGIQTNLTLMTEDLAAILRLYKVSVGISFDGIKDGNSARTKLFTAKDYNKKFELLKKYNVNYGFLFVTNQKNINILHKSFKFLDKMGIEGYKVNYAEDTNNIGSSEVSGKDFYNVVYKYFIDEFIKTGKCKEENLKRIIDKFIVQSLTHFINRERTNCGGKICGGGLNIVEIDPDGTIQYCGRYAEQSKETLIGKVSDNDFLGLKQVRRYTDFIALKNKELLKTNCDTCIADHICDHGCMAFHFSKYGKWGIRKDLVCESIIPLYKYMLENEFEIIKSYYDYNKLPSGELFFRDKIRIKSIKTNNIVLKKLDNAGILVSIDNSNDQTLIFKAKKV